MKTYDIVAIGEILIDYTPLPKSDNGMEVYEQNAGGAPANVLAAAAKYGAQTAFIGKVGTDAQGMFLKNTLEKANIETKGLVMDSEYFTTLAFVSLSNTGERSFSFARKHSADINLSEDELNMEIIRDTNIMHFGSLSLTDEVCREATLVAVQEAKASGAIISYDPNDRPLLWKNREIAKETMRSVLKYVDIIKISDEEIELMTRCKEPQLAADALLQQGIKTVVLTLGSKGAMVFTAKGSIHVTGCKVEQVVDTTGAGDSFFGALLYEINQSKKALNEILLNEWEKYMMVANATAAICVSRRGAINAMPTREEVEEMIKNAINGIYN